MDFITPEEVGITTHATTGPRPAPQPNGRPHCITLEQGRPVTSDQQRKQNMQEHDSNMPKISEPGLDESKLPYKAQSRPRRIACGKRLFRMETAERHSDLHPRTGRETEVETAAVSTTSGTTATDHQAEHTSDAQVQKRRRTSPLADYVPSTKSGPWDQKQCLRSQQSKCRLARGPRRQMRRKAIQITKGTKDKLSERMAQLKAIRQSSLQRCAQRANWTVLSKKAQGHRRTSKADAITERTVLERERFDNCAA